MTDTIIFEKCSNRIIILADGSRLISRIIFDDKFDGEDMSQTYILYQPHELIRMSDGRMLMVKWILETTDLIIPIAIRNVVTTATPTDEILNHYLQAINEIPKAAPTSISEPKTLH